MSRKDESEAEQITCTSMADSERFGVIRRVVAGLRLSLAVVSCCGDAMLCVSTMVSEIESNPTTNVSATALIVSKMAFCIVSSGPITSVIVSVMRSWTTTVLSFSIASVLYVFASI